MLSQICSLLQLVHMHMWPGPTRRERSKETRRTWNSDSNSIDLIESKLQMKVKPQCFTCASFFMVLRSSAIDHTSFPACDINNTGHFTWRGFTTSNKSLALSTSLCRAPLTAIIRMIFFLSCYYEM